MSQVVIGCNCINKYMKYTITILIPELYLRMLHFAVRMSLDLSLPNLISCHIDLEV